MPLLPSQIGRYRVLEVLGSGGFSTVYRAHDERLDDDVAIKVLAENHSLDLEVRERFVIEGHLLRRAASPHLVTVHDIGQTDTQQPYLVLSLADRGTLAERAGGRHAKDQDVEIGDALGLARFLAAALGQLHQLSIVHRDLAPGNVLIAEGAAATGNDSGGLLRDDERFVLADLGLSKDLARPSGLTVGGGTGGFAAPEQRAESGTVDPRADVWSASALIVWLLVGRSPVHAPDWRQTLDTGGVPQPVLGVLAEGLQENPADRQLTIMAWLEDLEGAAAPPRPQATVPAGASPIAAGRSPARSSRGRRVPWWVTALAVLALLVAAWAAGLLTAASLDAEQSVTEEGNGNVRVVSADGRAVILGPKRLTIGESVVYDAEVATGHGAVWIAPDGQTYTDIPQITVTPQGPGRGTVRLLAVSSEGQTSMAELRFIVSDD